MLRPPTNAREPSMPPVSTIAEEGQLVTTVLAVRLQFYRRSTLMNARDEVFAGERRRRRLQLVETPKLRSEIVAGPDLHVRARSGRAVRHVETYARTAHELVVAEPHAT